MSSSYPSRELTAVILAGGLGTRLRPAVSEVPKCLAEVCGRPFLHYLLYQLADFGLDRVVLSTGYRAAQVQQAVGTEFQRLEIAYSTEDAPLGTGGAVRLAAERAEARRYLVMNGDSYCEFSLTDLLNRHEDSRALMTMTLCRGERAASGSVTFNAQHHVTSFSEKSTSGIGFMNAGVYLINRQPILKLPSRKPLSLERDIFPSWIAEGITAYSTEQGRFIDIGTPETLSEAQRFFAGWKDQRE